MSEHHLDALQADSATPPSARELTILYRDEHLVAVHKPPGMLVHRTPLARGETQFVVQTLRDQLGRYVYPVHRLDRPTSGVLLLALSPEIAANLGEAFARQQVKKRYLAVVRGTGPDSESLTYPLREEDGHRPKSEMPASEAITEVRRLAEVELPDRVDRYPQSRYSLMEAHPRTGRRHQIRRHLSQRGYPIIGDAKHGKGNHNRFFRDRLDCPGLLLAATALTFLHPAKGRWLQLSTGLTPNLQALFERFGWSAHIPTSACIWKETEHDHE